MSGVERPLGSGELGQDLGPRAGLAASLRRIPALARREYAARFGAVESVLLGILIVCPLAIAWHFAAPYYFLSDDLIDFYRADHVGALSYLFEPGLVRGHLSPLSRFAYLALGRVAPMNFDVALASLLAFHAVSAVLLQRILTLLFGRAWWTYALALAWAISIAVYLPAIAWFAAGVHSITAITATLASIHGYLCWRTTGRRVWIIWSVAAMCIGLGFYEKAILIPFYLFLMRVLLLDPAAGLLDSLRSLQDEWRVWLAYATVCALYLVVYFLGGYSQLSGGFTGGEILGFLGAFWAEGFWPTMFGVRDLERQGDWHWIVIVATQVALFVLLVWSVVRRGTAWRPWAFLLVVLVANALLVVEKLAWIGQGPAITSHVVRYYAEPGLLVALTIPFVFAAPRLRARVAPVEPVAPPEPVPTVEQEFRLPSARAGIVALVALAAYGAVMWTSARNLPSDQPELKNARLVRAYFDTLRGDLDAVRRAGVDPSLIDRDVPESVVPSLVNFDPGIVGLFRASLLSSVVPLFDDGVTFNQPGHLYAVQPDGHLQRTSFVAVAGGSPAKLRRTGRLRTREAHVEHRGTEWCVVADGLSAVEWEPLPHLVGHDWWLRVHYRSVSAEPFGLWTDAGAGWVDEGTSLPPMDGLGSALRNLREQPDGRPTNAGVSLSVPPFGRLCLRSLEIGYLDPLPPSPG